MNYSEKFNLQHRFCPVFPSSLYTRYWFHSADPQKIEAIISIVDLISRLHKLFKIRYGVQTREGLGHRALFCLRAPSIRSYATVSSSWWRTPSPSRALPYWRPDAKYLSPLPSSMQCEPRNSVTVSPPQSFSAKWFLDDRRVSSSQMVDVVRQRWHDGGLSRDSTGPGSQRTSTVSICH